MALHEIKKFVRNEDDVADRAEETDVPVATDGQLESDVAMEAEDDFHGGPPSEAQDPRLAEVSRREEELTRERRRKEILNDLPMSFTKKARLDREGEAAGQPQSTAVSTQEVYMLTKRCSARGQEKQLEKELPWSAIPFAERHLYQKAEAEQWQEHVDFGAVKALDLIESERVRATVCPSRS